MTDDMRLGPRDAFAVPGLIVFAVPMLLVAGLLVSAPAALLASLASYLGVTNKYAFAATGALLGPAMLAGYLQWEMGSRWFEQTAVHGLTAAAISGANCGYLYWRMAVKVPARPSRTPNPQE